MTDTRVALGSDRLPWLDDEPAAKPKKGANEPWIVAAGAILLVAGGAYWVGVRTGHSGEPAASPSSGSVISAPLPAPQTASPPVEVQAPATPEVQPLSLIHI